MEFLSTGQKVKFKGVCRHSFWPTEGRTLNRSISLADVQLIQSMNMNAVRMSHYPPDEYFLDVCDSLGLYVLDELAGWQASYATTVGKKLVEETVTRDVNHPSIIFWDNGNEGGWNTALDTCFPFWDIQKRTVLHPWATFSAINTQHYPTYSGVQAALGGSTIYMPTEFLHGLYDGGAGSGLYDYWNLMYNSPLCAGGFIWALLDEAVVRTDQGNILDARVNLAPDGIVGPYREKKGSYATIKNVWSPVYIDMDTLPASFSGIIPIQNRYDFTALNKCSFTWKLGSSDFFTGDTGIASAQIGSCTAPAIAPHASGTLNLSLPSNWKTYDVLQLTAYNPDGKLICTWSWMLHSTQQICSRVVDTTSTTLVTCTQGSASILVTAGTMEYVFNKKGGRLTAVRKGGKDISFTADSLLLVGGAMADTVVVTLRSNVVSLVVTSADTASSIQWTIYGNGLCKLSYKYPLSGTYAFHGVTFNYPEANVRSAQWMGKGPYHVWRNRMKGGTDNVWQQAYNNGTPGTSWIYPEFKGYFADVKWMRLLTSEDTITIINDTPATFVRLFTPQMGTTPLNAIAAFPRGDISLLHEIAPMGNKFHSADNTGPQGTLVTENKTISGSSYLYFGKLNKVSAIAAKDTIFKVAQQVPVTTSTTPANAAIVLRHRGKGSTAIDFYVPTESNITLNLSDILGRKSITLYKQRTGTGWHTFEFSSANASIPRGIYIVQLVSNGRTLVTRTLGAY